VALDVYRKLQQHLNRMPVGFPRTHNGVEIRILRRLFTPRQAEIALSMDSRLAPLVEIRRRARESSSVDRSSEIEAELKEMARQGAVLNVRRDGTEHYALLPFAVGMFEFQLDTLSAEMYQDTVTYFKSGFALEYLSTAVPQTRVVPIGKSIDSASTVATYDEIRTLIRHAQGRVGVAPCICRKGRDLMDKPCRRTDRRELCLVLRDLYEHGHRQGWVRPVSTERALALLAENERAGLVLQPSNEQEPQFICSCCGCCCGILGMLKALPEPAAFTAGNYRAMVDGTVCNGCGVCVQRCPMGATALLRERVHIAVGRCIGCGVCVLACKPEAIRLIPKPETVRPPATTEALYDTIGKGKAGITGRAKTGVKIVRQWQNRAARRSSR
jgi:ferredoxin